MLSGIPRSIWHRITGPDPSPGTARMTLLNGRTFDPMCRKKAVNRYHVYIMSNQSRTLYIGVTGNLEQRVLQHKSKLIPGFTAKYNITKLVWYEEFTRVDQAIACEKRLKGWTRAKKIALIEERNERWDDLAANWNSSLD